ncbi:MAG: hypothetical protein C0483_12710 [Pirellula sp.]|nr:hypothetical protein [Pirellula sp.]
MSASFLAGGNDSSVTAAERAAPLPAMKDVAAAVSKQLARTQEYHAGDLITRLEIEGALEAAAKQTGWRLTTKQHDELVERGVEDRSFLAKQLTSKSGRVFSRHIAQYQLGYDQLDRLSKMPQGRSTIERLVRGPDGWKLIEYMAKAPGGHELGRMLSETPKGGNFEKATGRIYTEAELIDALAKLHKAAAAGSTTKPSR